MKTLVFLLLASVVVTVVTSFPVPPEEDLDAEFEAWKIQYNKSYSSPEEEAKRRVLWLDTRTRVIAHNKMADQGLSTYWMGVNAFADKSPDEFRSCLG